MFCRGGVHGIGSVYTWDVCMEREGCVTCERSTWYGRCVYMWNSLIREVCVVWEV